MEMNEKCAVFEFLDSFCSYKTKLLNHCLFSFFCLSFLALLWLWISFSCPCRLPIICLTSGPEFHILSTLASNLIIGKNKLKLKFIEQMLRYFDLKSHNIS